MTEQEKEERANKYFLEPNIEPLDENTQRIRRNLLAASIIVFFIACGSSGIDPESTFLGIKFKNADLTAISVLVLFSVSYFLFHFCWSIQDHFTANKLRLTGLQVAKAGTNWGPPVQYDTEVEKNSQSTIYGWFSSQVKEQKMSKLHLTDTGEEGDQSAEKLSENLEQIEEKLFIVRIALNRLEKGFWAYQKSQLLRWYILDVGIPVFLGSISIGMMLAKIYLS